MIFFLNDENNSLERRVKIFLFHKTYAIRSTSVCKCKIRSSRSRMSCSKLTVGVGGSCGESSCEGVDAVGILISSNGSPSVSGITTTGGVYAPKSTCDEKFGAFSGSFGTVIKFTKYCKLRD